MQIWWKKEYLSYLFEMVKSSKDDLVSSSDQTHSGQQLQNQGFGPAECKQNDTYTKKPNLHKILSATNSDKTFQGKLRIPDTTPNQSRNLHGAGQMDLLVLWLANYRGIIPLIQGAIH